MINAVVVDDEPACHDILSEYLRKAPTPIQVQASAFGVEEGIKAIMEYRPQLVFLDVEMPDGTGFDLLAQIGQPFFQIIFITAHNQYAQTAIRMGALDYLVKPITLQDLTVSILRLQVSLLEQIQRQQLLIIQDVLEQIEKRELPRRMSIATTKGVMFFATADIIRLEAMENFTEFLVQGDDRRLIASVNLKKFELDLKPYHNFMRVHRSHLVNLIKVSRFIKGDTALLEMENGDRVPISKRWKDKILQRLSNI